VAVPDQSSTVTSLLAGFALGVVDAALMMSSMSGAAVAGTIIGACDSAAGDVLNEVTAVVLRS
jgi:hypothetical protein